ncbi:MAG: OmpA family protein [Alphaproteobacteria bacterium]|nr:OmpA family protein [Alphaproteobacteria bacterium]
MHFKKVLLGPAVALAASAGVAQAGTVMPDGWYVSLAAGANWIQDGDMTWQWPSTRAFETYSWDTGYTIAAAVGYDFGKHWRAELEVAYRHNDVKNYCVNRPVSSAGCGLNSGPADVWELSQMVNVYYDMALGGRWTASLGAGIGGNLITFNPGFNSLSYDDYVFAGQLIGEVGYRLSNRWQLFADYHFILNDKADLSGPAVSSYPLHLDKVEHSLTIGLRFDLQSDNEPAPQPERPRPAEPMPPKQFIVFFGFNKSNLSSEARRVVSEAAMAAKDYGAADIIVIGHTDTVGSQRYNMRLSIRRAGAVKAELVHNGIKPDMIETSGRGETELMVQTGDGVKEPQNRRATIDLE